MTQPTIFLNEIADSPEMEKAREFLAEKARLDSLTPTQRKVLLLVCEGSTSKKIGETLNISARTVEFHKFGIRTRTGATDDVKMTRLAIRHGLIEA